MTRYSDNGGVDIVIMNCDNIDVIVKCINSILSNTQGKYNLIVIDQGSKDGSREWLQSCKGISHLILNDVNLGAWEGRNQGIRVSKYDWIVFLDSDTEIQDPEWLDKIWNYTVDSTVGVIEARVKIWDGSYMFGGFAACMIRKAVFQDIGLFDKHFMIGGDQDFWVKFAWFADWKISWCDDTEIIHHCGRTINRDRKKPEDLPEHKHFRIDLPRHIYTSAFLGETVGKIDKLRVEEMKNRGWV